MNKKTEMHLFIGLPGPPGEIGFAGLKGTLLIKR
jgi:hypothetical protein